MAKRYYWLKLKNDFFTQARMKKLRKLPSGETLLIVYLKMQLLSVSTSGKIVFQGLEDTFAEEIALTIDEEPEDVEAALDFLLKYGLVEELSSSEYSLSEVKDSIGSETASAERMRQKRAKEREHDEQCSHNVTQCDDIYSNDVTIYRDREEIEKDIELEIEKEKDKKHTPKENCKEKFVAPQECEVERYLADRNVKSFTAKEFINYYAALGWKNKHGTPIADWKALLDTWIDRKDESNPEESREKTKFDFLESDFIRVLEDAGAISDGGLDYGVLREHDEWIEKIQEAEHKANEYNHHEGVCGWKPASRLGKGEWQ